MVNTPPHRPLSHPGLLTARVISKGVFLQNLGCGKDKQAGYLSPSPPPRGEGRIGLRTVATSLKLTQLHPGPGEPAVPAGNNITEQGVSSWLLGTVLPCSV